MKIELNRIFKGSKYTIGKIFINGEYFSDCIEDKDRGLDDSMCLEEIKKIKVMHQTAIPTGTYRVLLTYSPKFKKIMPLINNVKGFSGIRIHAGVNENSSSGCVIVGMNTIKGRVTNSKNVFNALQDRLKEAKDNNEDILITIQ